MMASLFRFGLVIVALVVTSAISYRYGVRQVETEEDRLLAEVAELRTAKSSLERDYDQPETKQARHHSAAVPSLRIVKSE